VAVAGELPDRLGAAVLETAREAFVQGMQLSSGIAAVIAVGLAILAVVMLRSHDDPSVESRTEAPPEHAAHIAPTRFEGAEG
jgi:DHA2 family multidrug resistance protein-like MFS transporter